MQLPYFRAVHWYEKQQNWQYFRDQLFLWAISKFDACQNFQRKNAGFNSRIEPKLDCRLFQMRGVVSASYILRVRVTPMEHFAETLKCVVFWFHWELENAIPSSDNCAELRKKNPAWSNLDEHPECGPVVAVVVCTIWSALLSPHVMEGKRPSRCWIVTQKYGAVNVLCNKHRQAALSGRRLVWSTNRTNIRDEVQMIDWMIKRETIRVEKRPIHFEWRKEVSMSSRLFQRRLPYVGSLVRSISGKCCAMQEPGGLVSSPPRNNHGRTTWPNVSQTGGDGRLLFNARQLEGQRDTFLISQYFSVQSAWLCVYLPHAALLQNNISGSDPPQTPCKGCCYGSKPRFCCYP